MFSFLEKDPSSYLGQKAARRRAENKARSLANRAPKSPQPTSFQVRRAAGVSAGMQPSPSRLPSGGGLAGAIQAGEQLEDAPHTWTPPSEALLKARDGSPQKRGIAMTRPMSGSRRPASPGARTAPYCGRSPFEAGSQPYACKTTPSTRLKLPSPAPEKRGPRRPRAADERDVGPEDSVSVTGDSHRSFRTYRSNVSYRTDRSERASHRSYGNPVDPIAFSAIAPPSRQPAFAGEQSSAFAQPRKPVDLFTTEHEYEYRPGNIITRYPSGQDAWWTSRQAWKSSLRGYEQLDDIADAVQEDRPAAEGDDEVSIFSRADTLATSASTAASVAQTTQALHALLEDNLRRRMGIKPGRQEWDPKQKPVYWDDELADRRLHINEWGGDNDFKRSVVARRTAYARGGQAAIQHLDPLDEEMHHHVETYHGVYHHTNKYGQPHEKPRVTISEEVQPPVEVKEKQGDACAIM